MKETKKMLIVVIALAIIAILVTVLAIGENKKQQKNLEEFNRYLNSTSNELIYFSRPSCYYCQLMETAKKTLLDDANVDYYDVNTDNISSSILDKMLAKLNITSFGTPTLAIVKEGNVVYTQSGVFSSESDNVSELKAFLEQYEIIEKSE